MVFPSLLSLASHGKHGKHPAEGWRHRCPAQGTDQGIPQEERLRQLWASGIWPVQVSLITSEPGQKFDFDFRGATVHIPLTKSATLNRLLHCSLWQFSGALFYFRGLFFAFQGRNRPEPLCNFSPSSEPNTCTVEPRYKEVGYNKTLLWQGNSAGPTSLYFFVFLPWYNEKPDITR